MANTVTILKLNAYGSRWHVMDVRHGRVHSAANANATGATPDHDRAEATDAAR